MLADLLSSTYEITPGKKPAFVLAGQSNAASGYLILEMARILNRSGVDYQLVWDAHPGQQISYWYTGTPQTGYTELTDAIDALDSDYEIRGIFWIQGEWNALYGTTGTFQTYTENMFNALISHLGYTPDINISKVWYAGSNSTVQANMATIRTLQDAIQTTYTGRKIDIYHYDRFDDWHLYPYEYENLAYDMLTEYAKWKTGVI
jgi:hypothetical protein